MIKMEIYEPAMCCPTGLCGPSIDPELLRISTVMNKLEKNDSEAVRYNLTNNPQEFVDNEDVNKMMMDKGVEILPITLIDGQIKKTAAYPTNAEISEWLNVPLTMLEETENENRQESGGCCGEPATEQASGCCGGESSEGCC